MDQTTVLLARSFAVIAGGLFSWSMIDLVVSGRIRFYLADQKFSLLVLAGGVMLGIMVILKIRALALRGAGHAHGHDHHHGHSHEHAPGECCDHDHSHAHEHAHTHEIVSLWRYIVLAVPLMIILSGLAPQGLSADIYQKRMSKEQIAAIAAVSDDMELPDGRKGEGQEVFATIKELSDAAIDSNRRGYWESVEKPVRARTIGQFVPEAGFSNRYRLMRIKITCCAADATPVGVMVMGTFAHLNPKHGDWLEIVGPVSFIDVPNTRTGQSQYFTVVHQQIVMRTTAPSDVYLQ